MENFLTGSTFPLSLIRRPVTIEPASFEDFLTALRSAQWASFWGHANTLQLANRLTGVDLTPQTERPAVTLSPEGFPQLYGKVYHQCWVLSPDYVPGYRPAIGQEVQLENIIGWQVLKLTWKN